MARLIQGFARSQTASGRLLVLVGAETAQVPKESLESVARECGVADRVVFAGRVPHNEVATFYRQADLALMPSLEETFGLPIVEAMSLGCPVLTSNFGSMAEVAGDAACLVDPYQIGSIAAGIDRILDDPSYRNGLIERGRARAAHFTNNRSVEKIAEALEEAALLSARPGSADQISGAAALRHSSADAGSHPRA